MKRIKIIALVAALCIAFGMTGCQPAGSGETTTEATTTEATTTETTEEPTTTTTTEATTTTTTEEETTTTTTTEATTTTKKPKETKDTKDTKATKDTKDTKPSETKKDNKKDNKKDKYKGMSDFEIAESFIGKKAKDLIKVIGGKLEVVQACVDDVGMAIIKYKDFTVQCEQKTPNSDWIVTQVF